MAATRSTLHSTSSARSRAGTGSVDARITASMARLASVRASRASRTGSSALGTGKAGRPACTESGNPGRGIGPAVMLGARSYGLLVGVADRGQGGIQLGIDLRVQRGLVLVDLLATGDGRPTRGLVAAAVTGKRRRGCVGVDVVVTVGDAVGVEVAGHRESHHLQLTEGLGLV